MATASGQQCQSEGNSHLVARAAHNGREDSPGGIIAGKACLNQARPIVTHQGSGFLLVTHVHSDSCNPALQSNTEDQFY